MDEGTRSLVEQLIGVAAEIRQLEEQVTEKRSAQERLLRDLGKAIGTAGLDGRAPKERLRRTRTDVDDRVRATEEFIRRRGGQARFSEVRAFLQESYGPMVTKSHVEAILRKPVFKKEVGKHGVYALARAGDR